MEKKITTPSDPGGRQPALQAGDSVLLTGTIYTARDAAHKRLCERGARRASPCPLTSQDATIYYVGPTPAKAGQVIGSAGPTTSYRMDAYSPTLIALGASGHDRQGASAALRSSRP